MCIIAISPVGKPMFSDETIKNMFRRNDDGAGIMYVDINENKVRIKKGFMTVDDVLDFVHQRTWDDIPVVMHFRIGTSGTNSAKNCHPYPINKKNSVDCTCNVGMAHNGVMYKYNPDRANKDDLNDTQIFIQEIINGLPKGWLKNKSIRELIEHDINGNRLAFLEKDGTITRFGNWVEDDGYFFSNESYKPPVTYTPLYFKDYDFNSTTILESDEKSDSDLSFNDFFEELGDGCYQLVCSTENEFIDYYSEIVEKCRWVEDACYETPDQRFYIEVDCESNCLFKYSLFEQQQFEL